MSPCILPTVPIVSLFTEPRVGKAWVRKQKGRSWKKMQGAVRTANILYLQQQGRHALSSNGCRYHKTQQGLFRWCSYRHDAHAQCYKWSQLLRNHAWSLLQYVGPEQGNVGREWEGVGWESLTTAILANCSFPTLWFLNIMTPQISTITKLNHHPIYTFHGSQDHSEVSSKQILSLICVVLPELSQINNTIHKL